MLSYLVRTAVVCFSLVARSNRGTRRRKSPLSSFERFEALESRALLTVPAWKVSQDTPALIGASTQDVSDVSLSLSGGTGNVVPGELADYSMTVKNSGPKDAPITVTMTVPKGFVLEPSISTGWIQLNATTVTYTTSLRNGESRVISAAYEVGTLSGTQRVTATVTTTNLDKNAANNSLSWTTTITQPAYSDVSISLAGGTTSVPSTELIDLFMTVKNSGPKDAPITVTMTVPKGFILEASISDGWVQQSPTTVTYTAKLKSGESRFLAAAFAVETVSGSNTVTAKITTTNVDTNVKNNAISWVTNVTPVKKKR